VRGRRYNVSPPRFQTKFAWVLLNVVEGFSNVLQQKHRAKKVVIQVMRRV
jgi:hypothetical protein